MTPEMLKQVAERLDGNRIKDLTAELAGCDRIQASPGYSQAVGLVSDALDSALLDGVEVICYPADGGSFYYQWEAPSGWEAKSASLNLIHPVEKTLCVYGRDPLCLTAHSTSADVEAELVDVGDGSNPEDYRAVDVEGKIAMFHRGARYAHMLAVKNGAVGTITYPSAARAEGHPEMALYDAIWPDSHTRNQATFGFSITRRQADEIFAEQAKGGTVRARARVDARCFDGALEVVEALLLSDRPTEEEIVLVAHLCHPAPSANDNASGSAMLVALMNALAGLFEGGAFPNRRYNIRALWVPEIHGTAAYLAGHEAEVRRNARYCINLDMVGESPDAIGTPLVVYQSPWSTPSILNDVISFAAEQVQHSPLSFEEKGSRRPLSVDYRVFFEGSDHVLFSNACFGIPSVMLGHDDPFTHTNLDTPDKVDPTELKRVGLIAGFATLLLANADGGQFSTIFYEVGRRSSDRLNRLGFHLMKLAEEGGTILPDYPEDTILFAERELELFLEMEMKVYADLGRLYPGRSRRIARMETHLIETAGRFRKMLKAGIDDKSEGSRWADEHLRSLSDMRLSRRYDSIICDKNLYAAADPGKLAEFRREVFPAFCIAQEEFYNLFDGERSVLDVMLILEMEYGYNLIEHVDRILGLWKQCGILG